MANRIVRAAIIAANNKQIATIETADLDATDQSTEQIGQQGYMGHSTGAQLTNITINTFVPVSGEGHTTLEDEFRAQRYVKMQWFSAGRIKQLECRITQYRETSSTREGHVKGTFTFMGGQPRILGL